MDKHQKKPKKCNLFWTCSQTVGPVRGERTWRWPERYYPLASLVLLKWFSWFYMGRNSCGRPMLWAHMMHRGKTLHELQTHWSWNTSWPQPMDTHAKTTLWRKNKAEGSIITRHWDFRGHFMIGLHFQIQAGWLTGAENVHLFQVDSRSSDKTLWRSFISKICLV